MSVQIYNQVLNWAGRERTVRNTLGGVKIINRERPNHLKKVPPSPAFSDVVSLYQF